MKNPIKKIIALALCSLICPVILQIRWLPNLYNAIFKGRYEFYDFRINSLTDFLKAVYGSTYFILAFVSLILIFLPFQLIKDSWDKRALPLSLWVKGSILSGLFLFWILIFGTFSNIWLTPWYKNLIYIFFSLGTGFLFAAILHVALGEKDSFSKKA